LLKEEKKPIRSKRTTIFNILSYLYLLLIGLSVIALLIGNILAGILIVFGLILLSPILLTSVITSLIFKWSKYKAKLKKADEEELKREDDVLLFGIGFLQSTYFLILTRFLQSDPEYLRQISFSIFLTTVTFYLLRGKAKISNDSKWRYRSMFIVFPLALLDFLLLVINSISQLLKIILPSDVYPFTYLIIFVIVATIIEVSIIIGNPYFEARYGQKNKPT